LFAVRDIAWFKDSREGRVWQPARIFDWLKSAMEFISV
jgi:hypothetical protein